MQGTASQAQPPLRHPKQYLVGRMSPIRAGQDLAAQQWVPKAGLAGVAQHCPPEMLGTYTMILSTLRLAVQGKPGGMPWLCGGSQSGPWAKGCPKGGGICP